jgi:hypothetical protein
MLEAMHEPGPALGGEKCGGRTDVRPSVKHDVTLTNLDAVL